MIYILIGPKGSGKSFIGNLMEKHLGIYFLEVEKHIKNLKGDRKPDDPNYVREAFEKIEHLVRDTDPSKNNIVFESTGLSVFFDSMIQRLEADYRIIKIKISASSETCLSRVRNRNASRHIPISDEQVMAVNNLVLKKSIPVTTEIVNDDLQEDEILHQLRKIIS